MKPLFLFIALAFIGKLNATNYYFSSSIGDDSRTAAQAQNPATPWKTLGKLNTFFSNLQPGDSVLFKRGDTFYGSITVAKSGAPNRPIVLSAYGTGEKPVISGFTTLSSWTSLGGGVYQSPCPSCKPTVNMLTINDKPQMLGRYPNSGYLTFESHVSNTSITDKELNGTPNWTGAEVVIRKNRWVIDRNKISSHSGNTIIYAPASTYQGIDGYGYFIQNDKKTLDTFGEWYLEPIGKKMQVYFGSNTPLYTVKTSTIDTLVLISYLSYLTFDNLSFEGANVTAFQITASDHITIQNCGIAFSGGNGVTGPWSQGSSYIKIEKCIIVYINNNAIDLSGDFPYALIKQNTIKNTGTFPGMGKSGDGTYQAITARGKNSIIEYNELTNTGYVPIWFAGDNILVKNNFIDSFALLKDDGGGVYTWTGGVNATLYHGMEITGNIILNGIGNGEGTNQPNHLAAEGIYADDNSSDIKISRNTVAYCSNNGVYLHNTHDLQISNNTSFNNSTQIKITHDDILPTIPTRNVILQNNIFFSAEAKQGILSFETLADDIDLFGNADNNYYARPMDDNYTLLTQPSPKVYPGVGQSLTTWQTRYKKDANSRKSPITVSEYIINKIVGPNKFSNGYFNTNIDGSYCWNPSQSCIASWDNSGKINGGSLKISYTKTTDGITSVIIAIGSIEPNKKYELTYSVVGTRPGSIATSLRQSSPPYNTLSPVRYAKITTSPLVHKALFNSAIGEGNTSIEFQVEDSNGTFWLDNIELHEADVKVTNPDDYVRFEYNAMNLNKVIPLDGIYLGIDSTIYSNTITLVPYSSIVLMKAPSFQTLPLQFIRFESKKVGKEINIMWETANESNTGYYEVLKSSDGTHFEAIGRKTATNKSSLSTYTFTDNNPFSGKNYYRIKEVDKDGKTVYSKIIIISFAEAASMQISPNPATDKIIVSLSASQESRKATLLIQNISGNVLKNIPVSFSAESIPVDVSTLSKGTYIASLLYGGTTINQKFIKQ